MTPSDADHRTPGALVIRMCRAIAGEPAYSTIVCPAIADFQQEVRGAHGRVARLGVHVRGYWALTKVLVVLLIAPPIGTRTEKDLREGAAGGHALVLLVPVLMAATWPVFGWFTALAAMGGALFAVTMRWWNNRHPAVTIDVEPDRRERPEINLSRIPVGGNAGGLIFAIGSVVIVIVGLPGIRWFTLAALVSGVLVAGVLFAWRRSHPTAMKPVNSIRT